MSEEAASSVVFISEKVANAVEVIADALGHLLELFVAHRYSSPPSATGSPPRSIRYFPAS